MAPAVVSGVAQTLSLFQDAKSHSSPREDKGTSSPEADVSKTVTPVAVDTISISSRSRQAVTDVKHVETAVDTAQKEKIKKRDAAVNTEKSGGAAAKVQFVYDQNGELSVRYMDSSDRLVYQSPSELMLQMKEAASKSDSSVDTKA